MKYNKNNRKATAEAVALIGLINFVGHRLKT